MPIGIQELVALLIVAAVVCFALYRRWKKNRDKTSGCSDCANDTGQNTTSKTEKKIHIYRRQD